LDLLRRSHYPREWRPIIPQPKSEGKKFNSVGLAQRGDAQPCKTYIATGGAELPVVLLQETYLSLLRLGKTELEINAVQNLGDAIEKIAA
jgi:hypothetical protein